MHDKTLGEITVTALQCPFCGSEQLKVEELDNASWVSCCECLSVGPMAYNPGVAIERWSALTTDMLHHGT